MKKFLQIVASTAVVATLSSGGALAQGALTGVEDLDDRVDDIRDDVRDEFNKSNDSQRFGANQFAQGWSGSLSASYSLSSGNTKNNDLSVGGRLRYGSGPWNHSFGVALEYAENNGTKTEEEIFATYDVNRYFNDRFYAFGLGSVRYDDFDSNRLDAFLGVGPGFRVINNASTTWRVQAGPGVRYIETSAGANDTEFAGLAASRFYHKINETVSLTNDTDVLYSSAGTLLTNEFGVNFKVSNSLTTRLGYRTEYNSDPQPGLKRTDNKLTAALVVGF